MKGRDSIFQWLNFIKSFDSLKPSAKQNLKMLYNDLQKDVLLVFSSSAPAILCAGEKSFVSTIARNGIIEWRGIFHSFLDALLWFAFGREKLNRQQHKYLKSKRIHSLWNWKAIGVDERGFKDSDFLGVKVTWEELLEVKESSCTWRFAFFCHADGDYTDRHCGRTGGDFCE